MPGSIGDMQQECATVLPAVELAYATYGTLAPVVKAALTSVGWMRRMSKSIANMAIWRAELMR